MKTYVINLSYDKRMSERNFIKETLQKYDEQTLTGSILYIDNYTKKIKWVLYFDNEDKQDYDFDSWLREKNRNIDKTYQKRLEDSKTYFIQKGWNATTINDPDDVDKIITRMPNGMFLYAATS